MINKHAPVTEGVQKRFAEIRNHLGLTQREFAQRLGCHVNRVSEIEKGLREAPKTTILALSFELNVNLNWLVLGVGKMFHTLLGQPVNKLDKTIKKPTSRTELLKKLIEEKERLLSEKEIRIKLLDKMLEDR